MKSFSRNVWALIVMITITISFQILPIISIPITTIPLAKYSKFRYGLFGWCIVEKVPSSYVICTGRGIGYQNIDTSIYGHTLSLPSDCKYSVSKLLVVHVIAFIFSCILLSLVCLMNFTSLRVNPKLVLAAALWSLPTFLLSLLSFLVDILLFAKRISWPGWLMLAATVMQAFCCSIIWSLRRTVSIINYEALYGTDSNSEVETYSMHNLSKSESLSTLRKRSQRMEEDILQPELSYSSIIT